MFPTGAAGVALFLLRVSVATTLVTNIFLHGDLNARSWELLGPDFLGVALCLGLFTPVSCAICCFLEITTLLDVKDPFFLLHLSSILVAISLGILGPGAYSVDARMFGRKLVVSSSDK
jgi:hypothetical protein